ncbi:MULTISPECIES: hypothetical protein [Enterobacteriaceae]|uniref:hypothetical protein n=1 Tax=Enterobacteriaceae TaxID=543 RepID=UPI000272A920|nr:hypothetical protein [Enterobacter sp. Ag1]EJF33105.1 hypothetical protein A936_02522 [Enterobacter sp. Ag1]
MKQTERVNEWLKKRCSICFFLPNGPYGRPFDNQYYVDEVKELEDGFIIHFTDDLALRFNGEVTILESEDKLIIEDFRVCEFECRGIIQSRYDYGHVSLC